MCLVSKPYTRSHCSLADFLVAGSAAALNKNNEKKVENAKNPALIDASTESYEELDAPQYDSS